MLLMYVYAPSEARTHVDEAVWRSLPGEEGGPW